jgi:hypothetical protein
MASPEMTEKELKLKKRKSMKIAVPRIWGRRPHFSSGSARDAPASRAASI